MDRKTVAYLLISGLLVFGAAGSHPMAGTKGNQPAEEEKPQVLIALPDGTELHLTLIPAGSFQMGSPVSEEGRESDEGPQHRVTISRAFYIGTYEITHAQWQAVMGEIRDNSGFDGSSYETPMQSTSWNEWQGFLEKLNELGLGRFRMPTEAEWEYAARAGTESRFYWGEDPDYEDIVDYAWFDENSEGQGHPVGQRKPNAWGLYDTSGNAWEWCQDWYGPYLEGDQTDPIGPETGEFKIFRGGEWFNPAETSRSAFRGKFAPDRWLYFGGLRVLMEVPE
ncbi:MAG: formylglycine-generating enzyme family protein [Acidobacteriota bacterium]|nr:MAG: formylglycine-generating enzyme family protein [Acidobacteriota bacterium]